ncbi:hypothetical protein TCE0_060r18947 [Talaromyces pinophilus]|uniref:Uncharacterized protein n=1 Tax=Talaromyces pinophilus TaxID=128442 RepID=A0A6V8HTJ0_TALPI|nr:hypothetical protein TCE0_060r18947 [Talaromyces pinophilus]
MADEKILWCDVKDLFFRGPESNEQVMVSILDPVITVEYHNEHYYIAARFNIETTILHYESHKRDGHELFFEDICLQYLSKDTEEKLKVHPQSDPAGSFSVTTTSTTSVTGQVGVTGSQTPSGNVMLGVTRSKQLAVQYNVNTWSVSAHRMIPDDKQKRLKLKSDKVILNGRPMAGSELPSSYYDDPNQDYYHLAYGDELAIHQWYWQGTQAATKTLSPDLKYTVKRHVFVKRIIPRADFPTDRVRSGKRLHKVLKQEIRLREMSSHRSERLAAQRDRETRDIVKEEFRQAMFADSLALDQLLDFGFHLTVRVKKRFGRTHRTLMFSSNKVKADFLNPPYTQLFRIKVDPSLQILRDIPLSDTPNLEKILADVKEEYDGKLDDLLGASLDEVTDENLRINSKDSEQHEEPNELENIELEKVVQSRSKSRAFIQPAANDHLFLKRTKGGILEYILNASHNQKDIST